MAAAKEHGLCFLPPGSNQVSPSLAMSLWVVCITDPQFSHLENGGSDGNNRASLINHHHEIK